MAVEIIVSDEAKNFIDNLVDVLLENGKYFIDIKNAEEYVKK
jgi:hypothetical protein